MKHLSRTVFASSLFVTVIMAVVVGPHSLFAFSGPGSGTGGDPYLIANCVQLQEMNDDLTAAYKLVSTINCSDTENWSGGEGFTPIGAAVDTFTGSFDGDGYTILRLYINRPGSTYQGLFGAATGATISDVTITGTVTGASRTGGLIGQLSNATVTGVRAEMDVTGTDYTGGLIGAFAWNGSGQVSESSYNGSVIGDAYVGGLIGAVIGSPASSHVLVQESYSTGTVTANRSAGGLIGIMANGGVLQNAYSQSNVSEGSSPQGGFAGLVGYAGAGATIRNTYASGTVNAHNGEYYDVGGLVGGLLLASGDITIEHSFSIVTGATPDVFGLYGSGITAGSSIITSNNHYDVSNSGTHTCFFGGGEDETGCTGIDADNANYWKGLNHPVLDWSTSIWTVGTFALPVLTASYVTTDITAPTISTVSPEDAATDVHGDAPIVLTFSEPMDRPAVTISVSGCGGPCPIFDETWSDNERTLTLTQQAGGLFSGSTSYQVTVGSAKDIAQNAMAAPYVFSFTVASAPVLTATNTIPLQVRVRDAIYRFTTTQACDPAFGQLVGPGRASVHIDQVPRPGAETSVTFNDLDLGSQYASSVQCINSQAIASNTLLIGPFYPGGNGDILSSGLRVPNGMPTAGLQDTPRTLLMGMAGDDVLALQRFLNTTLTPVATKGQGSKGRETSRFGIMTRNAVMRFQKSKGIPADGIVGLRTRSLMTK